MATTNTHSYCYIRSPELAWLPATLLDHDDNEDIATVSVPFVLSQSAFEKSTTVIVKNGNNNNNNNNINNKNNNNNNNVTIVQVNLKHYPEGLPLQNVDETGRQINAADLTDLMFLNEPSILYNLKTRHLRCKPYTRSGTIMIAINPYQWIDRLYTPKLRNLYSHELIWAPQVVIEEYSHLEPHVYEVSAHAYRGLAIEGNYQQSILVSGESGAGKTETVKICLHHLASIQSGPQSHGMALANDKTQIVKRILDSNPLLEAFGNAQTKRNDNSSRFGKYLQLQFLHPHDLLVYYQNKMNNHPKKRKGKNAMNNNNNNNNNIDTSSAAAAAMTDFSIPECHLVGSTSQVYLLEKSRVVHHEPGERTFHIFYQILSAPDSLKRKVWRKLKNKTFESYSYIGGGEGGGSGGVDGHIGEEISTITSTTTTTSTSTSTDGGSGNNNSTPMFGLDRHTNSDSLQHTLDHLKLIGIRGKRLDYIMRGVCSVMQMGNITFMDGPEPDSCVIRSLYDLDALSGILGVHQEDLEFALTNRAVTAGDERMIVPLRPEVAKEYLDALAKEVYASIFNWLVNAINDSTCATKQVGILPENFDENALRTISLLDIFGFEHFEKNGFEQLCINFANEMLQFKFTSDCFESVFEEYASEGISLDRIGYDDNTDVLDLIQTPRTGLMSALNEECIVPRGNDESFCRKFVSNAKSSGSKAFFFKPLFDRYSFGIHHYAGDIVYDCRGFVTKNKDTLPTELMECIVTKSTNPIIVLELSNKLTDTIQQDTTGRKRSSALVAPTVWTKYRSQLKDLMDYLNNSRNWYIRCIKPNDKKKPKLMNNVLTVDQLRSAGVIAAVTMSRAAFPNRLDHKQVVDRFGPVWNQFWCKHYHIPVPTKSKQNSMRSLYREDVEHLLSSALQPLEIEENGKIRPAYVVGRTKAFFVSGALEYLEAVRFKGFEYCAIVLQRFVRGGIVREYVNHEFLMDRVNSRKRIQMWWRCMKAKMILRKLKRKVELEEEEKKMKIDKGKKQIVAATAIQSVFRGKIQREKYNLERSVNSKNAEMGDDVSHLEEELRRLEQYYETRAQDHARQLQEIEEERRKESESFTFKYFGESVSAFDSSSLDLSIHSHVGKKKSILENDDVVELRAANKKLRKRLLKMEQEKAALEQNIKLMTESNEEAKHAIIDAKNVSFRLLVRNTRLKAEIDVRLEDMRKKVLERNRRVSELDVEKQKRSLYLNAMNQVCSLVKKEIPDTRLATDVERVAAVCIATERRRLGKGGVMTRQDSVRSLTSLTSETEHSDADFDLNEFFNLR